MQSRKNLSNDVDHFLSFIAGGKPDALEREKKRIIAFFSREGTGNSYVLCDRGDLFFYADEKLADSSSLGEEHPREGICRFDGTRISSVFPHGNRGEYLMISGKKKKGTGGGSSGGGGVSSNNNNNNNNNNNG